MDLGEVGCDVRNWVDIAQYTEEMVGSCKGGNSNSSSSFGFYDALNISGHYRLAFYSEREKSDKFFSEALISAEVLLRAINL